MKGLLRRTPPWVVALVFAVAWTGMVLAIELLQGKSIQTEDVWITGAFGLLLAMFALWNGRRVQRKEGKLPPGSPTGTNITKAMSTGKLPDHASAGEWVTALGRIDRQERHMAWLGPLVMGLATALGIFLIFGEPEHPWLGVVCSPLFLGLAVWMPFGVRRRRIRIRKLLAQFPQEEPLQRTSRTT